jgi:hypothetical protein
MDMHPSIWLVNGRYACIDVLLSNGVDASLPTADERGETPATICCFNGHVKCLALLSDKGADLSVVTKLGFTATHRACQAGELKCLQLLISRGATVNTVNVVGQTLLDTARRFKQPECVDLLLACGAMGSSIEDLPPVPEAGKVGKAASFMLVGGHIYTRLLYCCLILLLSYPASFSTLEAVTFDRLLCCYLILWHSIFFVGGHILVSLRYYLILCHSALWRP